VRTTSGEDAHIRERTRANLQQTTKEGKLPMTPRASSLSGHPPRCRVGIRTLREAPEGCQGWGGWRSRRLAGCGGGHGLLGAGCCPSRSGTAPVHRCVRFAVA
jgi:hypothetical protein